MNFQGKNVLVRVQHIGIEESFIDELISTKTFESGLKSFQDYVKKNFTQEVGKEKIERSRFGQKNPWDIHDENMDTFLDKTDGPIVISSIDTYHPISGLRQKLRAFLNFLEANPNYKNKVVFIQFVGSTV